MNWFCHCNFFQKGKKIAIGGLIMSLEKFGLISCFNFIQKYLYSKKLIFFWGHNQTTMCIYFCLFEKLQRQNQVQVLNQMDRAIYWRKMEYYLRNQVSDISVCKSRHSDKIECTPWAPMENYRIDQSKDGNKNSHGQ